MPRLVGGLSFGWLSRQFKPVYRALQVGEGPGRHPQMSYDLLKLPRILGPLGWLEEVCSEWH